MRDERRQGERVICAALRPIPDPSFLFPRLAAKNLLTMAAPVITAAEP